MVGSDDESGSEQEVDWMEEGGEGDRMKWSLVNRKRKKIHQQNSDSDKEVSIRKDVKRNEGHKVIVTFESPGSRNPLKISEALKSKLGNIVYAKTLQDGSIMVICKDEAQKVKALQIKSLAGYTVKCSSWKERRVVRGVVYGIPTEVTEEEIKRNVSNVKVSKVKRLQFTRDGLKRDSLSVMIQFEEEALPVRVMVGYMSYNVREYVPPPLRCYKCQRFGHVAAICKSKQRCGKCGGEHQYGECGENAKLKCCNCGEEHSAAYGGCKVRKRAVKVQNIKINEGITYAEAVKRMKNSETSDLNEKPDSMASHKGNNQSNVSKESLIIDKVKFVTFMAEVVNCSAQTKSRTERIKIIIRAAEKYLDVREITVEKIQDTLVGDLQGTQKSNG